MTSPILASVAQNRLAGISIAGAASAQVGLVSLGLPGWQCPILHLLGLPCPGCGLSRAAVALLQGEWQAALMLHAFAPFLLLAMVVIVGAVILPHKQRGWLISQLERLERRTAITAILLLGLLFYWLVRLLVFPEMFINLVKG